MAGFRIIDRKGFHITFENGFTVSVQFGPANYCDNYDADMWEFIDNKDICARSSDAEIACKNPAGKLMELPDGGTVDGYKFPAEVLEFMIKVSQLKEGDKLQ